MCNFFSRIPCMRTIGKTFHRRINVLLGEMRGNATEILNFEKRPSSKLATDALQNNHFNDAQIGRKTK